MPRTGGLASTVYIQTRFWMSYRRTGALHCRFGQYNAAGQRASWRWMTRWLWRRCPTRSHSELGRESLQRRWYFVLRHGRVGRCLVFQPHVLITNFVIYFTAIAFARSCHGLCMVFGAGWSSPVARQAHNLKVVGSNPTPATNYINKINELDHPQRLRFFGFFCVLT